MLLSDYVSFATLATVMDRCPTKQVVIPPGETGVITALLNDLSGVQKEGKHFIELSTGGQKKLPIPRNRFDPSNLQHALLVFHHGNRLPRQSVFFLPLETMWQSDNIRATELWERTRRQVSLGS
jgi:hypothetical protein